jgi:hypothetical protein
MVQNPFNGIERRFGHEFKDTAFRSLRIHSMELKDSDTMTIGSGGIRVVVSQL